MNLDRLQHALIASARAHSPEDDVPYGFEKRVIARLQSSPGLDAWTLWASGLWRAAAPCVAIMLLLCAWSALVPANPPANNDLTQEFEKTVLAAADQEQPPADLQR